MVGKDEESGAAAAAAAPFLRKTYEMVDDPDTDSMVSWSPDNKSFVVWNVPLFSAHLLPLFFKHNNFSSFVRQLNTYGFRKVPERWEFVNPGFVRGHKHLLKGINRRKSVQALAHHQPPSINNVPPEPCVQVAKFGIEEDVERLKMDKNVLMQELVRLRQQQSSTDTQLHSAGQRVQVMEQKQQQMMSFLAKAMHSPAFLSQLVQNKNDGNRHITEVNRKRSLPNHDEDILGMRGAFPDGQVVKYQPLINEAAKSMLQQILKLNAHLPDRSPTSFLLDFVPAASSVVNNAARISGVTLSEVLQTYQQPCFSTGTGLSTDLASEMHSNDVRISDPVLHNPLGDSNTSDFNQMNQIQGVVPENNLQFPDMTFSGAHIPAISFLDSLSSVQDGTLPMEVGECSPSVQLDGILPGSNDAFWEQFFPVSPSSEAAEEVDLSGTAKDHEQYQDEESEKLHHMNHLTEQMGLLTAEIERV